MEKKKPKICYNCGKKMKEGTEYSWTDEKLGSFKIPCNPGEYYFCSCGEERLHITLCLRIEREEEKRRRNHD